MKDKVTQYISVVWMLVINILLLLLYVSTVVWRLAGCCTGWKSWSQWHYIWNQHMSACIGGPRVCLLFFYSFWSLLSKNQYFKTNWMELMFVCNSIQFGQLTPYFGTLWVFLNVIVTFRQDLVNWERLKCCGQCFSALTLWLGERKDVWPVGPLTSHVTQIMTFCTI